MPAEGIRRTSRAVDGLALRPRRALVGTGLDMGIDCGVKQGRGASQLHDNVLLAYSNQSIVTFGTVSFPVSDSVYSACLQAALLYQCGARIVI